MQVIISYGGGGKWALMKVIALFYVLLIRNISMASDDYFLTIDPLREDTVGGSLGEIDCRMGGWPDWTIYRDTDKVTWAHEGTHSINARIRIDFKADNGFYLMRGQCITLKSPKVTLKQIADAIPRSERSNSLYPTYFIDAQKYWNHKPLYCIDELIAYLNGTIIGVELDVSKPRLKDTFSKTLQMYEYALVAHTLIKETDYVDQDKLDFLLTHVKMKLESLSKIIELP